MKKSKRIRTPKININTNHYFLILDYSAFIELRKENPIFECTLNTNIQKYYFDFIKTSNNQYKNLKIEDKDGVGVEFVSLLNDIPKLTSIFSEPENFIKLKSIRHYCSEYYEMFEKSENDIGNSLNNSCKVNVKNDFLINNQKINIVDDV